MLPHISEDRVCHDFVVTVRTISIVLPMALLLIRTTKLDIHHFSEICALQLSNIVRLNIF